MKVVLGRVAYPFFEPFFLKKRGISCDNCFCYDRLTLCPLASSYCIEKWLLSVSIAQPLFIPVMDLIQYSYISKIDFSIINQPKFKPINSLKSAYADNCH